MPKLGGVDVNVLLYIPNRTILVHFGGISGEFGRAAMVASSQNTHGETKRAWYAAEVYQNDTIRYFPYPNFSLADKIFPA